LMLVEFLKHLLVARSSPHVEAHARGRLMSFVCASLWVSMFVHVSEIVIFKIIFWVGFTSSVLLVIQVLLLIHFIVKII
jgi:hypothetical protein